MLKHVLTGTSTFVLLLAAGVSVRAQAPQPQSPVQTTPSSPATQQAPKQPSSSQISNEELQKFARSIKQLEVIDQATRTELTQAVRERGLSEARFIEILQAQKNPQAEPSKEVTSQERQQFEQALKQVGEIGQRSQLKAQQAIRNEGLEPSRFSQILAAVRQDPALQQRVQQLL